PLKIGFHKLSTRFRRHKVRVWNELGEQSTQGKNRGGADNPVGGRAVFGATISCGAADRPPRVQVGLDRTSPPSLKLWRAKQRTPTFVGVRCFGAQGGT